jgi:hypothetical protein
MENKQELMDGCDFCMQFDNDEIHVIAATGSKDGVMEIKITPTMDGGLTFVCPNTNKKLRLFARPLSDVGRAIVEANETKE